MNTAYQTSALIPYSEKVNNQEFIHGPVSQSPWLHVFNISKQPKIRLYCFPYAGGNASIFSKWPDFLGSDIEICAISLPGRWQRLNEPGVVNMSTLCFEIADAVRAESKTPFAFFGHSMGAILAFEVSLLLRKQGAMLPDHLFVSGAQAPHTLNEAGANRRKKVADMNDDEFLGYLQLLSGTPAELLQNPDMRAHVIKTMLPDLQAIDGWHYKPAKPFTQNISVFVGTDDPVIDIDAARAWEKHTVNQCELNIISGDHFFIHTQKELLTHKIKRILEIEALI